MDDVERSRRKGIKIKLINRNQYYLFYRLRMTDQASVADKVATEDKVAVEKVYGYSIQSLSIEDWKIRDKLFTGDIYTDIDAFIKYANAFVEEHIEANEDVDVSEIDMKEFVSKRENNFENYPLTRDNLAEATDVYWDSNNYTWSIIIHKHTII